MKYMGSKRRLAKHILPIMLKDAHKGQHFYDLFCGGGNLICEVPDDYTKVANDKFYYTYMALNFIKNHIDKIPKNKSEFTEEDYHRLKTQPQTNDEVLDGLKGYVGFALAYSGKWFNSFRKDSIGKRDYVAEAYRSALKQHAKLQNIKLLNKSYDEVELKPNSIIYLDPPYYNTAKYSTGNFNYEKFYDWCIKKHNEGHKVYISEYYMPSDKFKIVWEKQIKATTSHKTNTYKKAIERLYVVK